jgi:atypical dual specificity phosphatase
VHSPKKEQIQTTTFREQDQGNPGSKILDEPVVQPWEAATERVPFSSAVVVSNPEPDPQHPERLLDLWWVEPGKLAGMPMPLIATARRANPIAPLHAYDDDLLLLHEVGIRAVIGMLNIPGDSVIYRSAGFEHHLMPVPDGGVPTFEQFQAFVRFVDEQIRAGNPTAVHCAAGLGRTGTVLAGYLIAKGDPFETAVIRIRTARPGAIETSVQVRFLQSLAAST